MKRKKNIILIGMMGSLKSTVGRLLSERLGRVFVDADDLYEQTYGVSVTETFAIGGEALFRTREAAILRTLTKKTDAVLALGGGAVLHRAEMEALKTTGVTVFLYAAPEAIARRLKGDRTRPLLAQGDPTEKLKELYDARLSLYERFADIRIDNSDLDGTETATAALCAIDRFDQKK
ncbi:MAG: shikimate kinase [Clostridiales bacterium]|jgi:shikimate kinase|nr:shikimate kinase [Clostridiales bacterium]